MRLVRRYLILVGFLAHLAPLAAVVFVLQHFQLSVPQLAIKGAQKVGLDTATIEALFAPAPQHTDFVLDGTVRRNHPRLLPNLAKLHRPVELRANGIGRLDLFKRSGIQQPEATVNCSARASFVLAVCWAVTGDATAAGKAISLLQREIGVLSEPQNALSIGRMTGQWRLAVAYDYLYNASSMTDTIRERIETALARTVTRNLSFLDGDELSLWHSRASVAAETWFVAAVLDHSKPAYLDLARRAQAYFLDAIDGLQLTEAWPEGYNYWINNRALVIALGGAAYANALENASQSERVLEALRNAALWSVYAARPDERVEGLGDEGPRVDQKDETRRAIDLVASLTRDPVLSLYSRYLEQLYGAESYYRGYRWAFPLLNDPSALPSARIRAKDLSAVGKALPHAKLFGRNALNLAFIRSGWGGDDTMISFRAGASFSHHGHYDAGHFTLFKGAPLAVNASRYREIFSPHRLNFAIRTVAKNSILVLRPDEEVQPNRFFDKSIAAGGQRITMPTGSSIRDVRQWRDNLFTGLHLEGGDVLGWRHEKKNITYAYSDISAAYNRPDFDAGGDGGKVQRVTREIAYLHQEDILLVRDRVPSVKPEYTKKWIMQTINKPTVDGLRVLRGDASDGILQSEIADEARIENGRGRLILQKILPQDGLVRVLGGPNHQFYVETDGDDSDLDGENIYNQDPKRTWFDNSNWRIEIQSRRPAHRTDFLMALIPSIAEFSTKRVKSLPLSEGKGVAVYTADTVVAFAEPSDRRLRFDMPSNARRLYVLGLLNGTVVIARDENNKIVDRTVTRERMAVLSAITRPEKMTITIEHRQ